MDEPANRSPDEGWKIGLFMFVSMAFIVSVTFMEDTTVTLSIYGCGASALAAGGMTQLVRWVNRRDDPRHSHGPPDAP